jgi:glycosyltransferase involved in cell wall biosynthesis
MTPRISVLLTSYNREPFIAESIESVLAQTLGDFELIVSDDRSTDGTVDIVSGYARRDTRIRFSINEKNLGQFDNRRHAASLASGRFLKYHDSDDVMYPHCLAAMVEPLDAEPRAAFALSASGFWPGGQCPMLLTPELAYRREYLGSGLFQLGPAAAMFRTQAFRDLGGFPVAGVASDYLFWLKACAAVNVLLVPGDLFYYRVHEGQELVSATAQREYAQASSAAWRMLHSPDCPLRGASLEQAKRNFVYTLARKSFRQSRRHQFASALATLRYSGIGPAGWLRYLRPPRRTSNAGTPAPRPRVGDNRLS